MPAKHGVQQVPQLVQDRLRIAMLQIPGASGAAGEVAYQRDDWQLLPFDATLFGECRRVIVFPFTGVHVQIEAADNLIAVQHLVRVDRLAPGLGTPGNDGHVEQRVRRAEDYLAYASEVQVGALLPSR